MFFIAIPIILIASFFMALHSLKKELEKERLHRGSTIFASRELTAGKEEFL